MCASCLITPDSVWIFRYDRFDWICEPSLQKVNVMLVSYPKPRGVRVCLTARSVGTLSLLCLTKGSLWLVCLVERPVSWFISSGWSRCIRITKVLAYDRSVQGTIDVDIHSISWDELFVKILYCETALVTSLSYSYWVILHRCDYFFHRVLSLTKQQDVAVKRL